MDRERDDLSVEDLAWGESGLLPAVVQDGDTGEVLMLAWMDREALARTLASGRAWFWSRSRQAYWMKGEESGNVLDVDEVRYDCDADSLLLTAELRGDAACHTGERTCFYRTLPVAGAAKAPFPMDGPLRTAGVIMPDVWEPETAAHAASRLGDVLTDLTAVLEQRKRDLPEGSYTTKLLSGPQDKLLKKIAEESGEVIIAARDHDLEQTRYEAADLLYHLLVVLVREGVPIEDLASELSGRFGLAPRQ
jgi:phosphoribosyl-ATP pyrophosphohydrolase/phosphoribosyl-AMP cyclohydrolase